MKNSLGSHQTCPSRPMHNSLIVSFIRKYRHIHQQPVVVGRRTFKSSSQPISKFMAATNVIGIHRNGIFQRNASETDILHRPIQAVNLPKYASGVG